GGRRRPAPRHRHAAGRGGLAAAGKRLPRPARPGLAGARVRGALCRYVDDLVVMCQSRAEAERALVALRSILAELGLAPKEAKTRIVHLREGGEGLDFLGFHHRYVRGNTPRSRHLTFLARWPSRQA